MASSDDHRRIRAAESRIEFAAAGTFTLLLAGTLIYVHSLFAPLMPAARLWTWTLSVAAVIALLLGMRVVITLRQPDDDEINRFWSPLGKVSAILYDLAVAASVWMLLPYASEPLRLLMVVFYAAAVGGQVISTAESLGTVAFGVISIFGSAALFFLLTPGPYSVGLAVFLLGFGLMMMMVALTLKRAVRGAFTARLRAETASARLAGALAEVTEARDARTRFIAAAAHDLRQPLQAAALFFQQAVSGAAAVRAQATEGVRLALQEADGLLERMLDYLRLDAGAVEAKLEDVSADALMRRVVDETYALAEMEGCGLEVEPSTLNLRADPLLAGRILRNFVHNALAHASPRRIVLEARTGAEGIRLYVVDDGAGVPLIDRDRIFGAYQRGGDAGARRGLGLGLASAARMAELMGGRVGLDPMWTAGAAFYVELPAVDPTAP